MKIVLQKMHLGKAKIISAAVLVFPAMVGLLLAWPYLQSRDTPIEGYLALLAAGLIFVFAILKTFHEGMQLWRAGDLQVTGFPVLSPQVLAALLVPGVVGAILAQKWWEQSHANASFGKHAIIVLAGFIVWSFFVASLLLIGKGIEDFLSDLISSQNRKYSPNPERVITPQKQTDRSDLLYAGVIGSTAKGHKVHI